MARVNGKPLTEEEILELAKLKAKDVRTAQNKAIDKISDFLNASKV